MSSSSTKKQFGALMSSRFIPPKVGLICSTMFTISSGFCVFRTIGIASTSQNSLNKIALPSMTGNQAKPQILPSHKTAVPSLTTATELLFRVYSYASSGFFCIARHGSATQGV